jgi:hypothetical protein
MKRNVDQNTEQIQRDVPKKNLHMSFNEARRITETEGIWGGTYSIFTESSPPYFFSKTQTLNKLKNNKMRSHPTYMDQDLPRPWGMR